MNEFNKLSDDVQSIRRYTWESCWSDGRRIISVKSFWLAVNQNIFTMDNSFMNLLLNKDSVTSLDVFDSWMFLEKNFLYTFVVVTITNYQWTFIDN